MEKKSVSVHDKLFVGDTITIDNLDCRIDSGMIIGVSNNCFRMLSCIDENKIKWDYYADIDSNRGFSISDEQQKAIKFIKDIIDVRIGAISTPECYLYKNVLNVEGIDNVYGSLHDLGTTVEGAVLDINNKKYPVSFYSAFTSVSDSGLICGIIINEANKELLSLGLYTNCSFEVQLEKELIINVGNVVRIQATEKVYLFYIHSYPMEMIQASKCGNVSCEKGMHLFKFVEFLVKSVDDGVTEMQFPESYKPQIEDYIIVGIIKNLQVNIEDLAIGTVRIGKVSVSENFEKELSKIEGEYTVVWVTVREVSFYKAFEKGKELIGYACDFISLALKNDMFIDWYGTDDISNTVWDVMSHVPNIELGTLFYVEDCLTGESLTFDDKKKLSPTSIGINNEIESIFDKEWIDDFFEKINESDEHNLRLQYAIRWIVQAWKAENNYDRLIYCSTALEFIANGEKGCNILDEYAQEQLERKFTRRERKNIVNSLVERMKIDTIEGFTEDGMAALNTSIEKIVRKSLGDPSFNSKINNLIERLKIPVSEEEKQLLFSARGARNKLIHGIEMQYITHLDAKKLCGITSRLLVYKIKANMGDKE